MDKRTKLEVNSMLSLMERMDKHMTLRESEFEKALLNEDLGVGRADFQSLDDLVNTIDIGSSFVGLGYIQGYSNITNDGPVKIYPTADGFDKMFRGEIGKVDPSSRLAGKLNNMVSDPEYSNPTGRLYAGNRSMAQSPFQGVVKITNYVFNWGDAESLSNFYQKNRDKIANIRKNHGFGDGENYADDDWRRRVNKSGKSVYSGLGAYPEYTPKKNLDGSDVKGPFTMKLNPTASIYGDNDTYGNAVYKGIDASGNPYQRRALRFGLGNIQNQWEHYCLVDNAGEVDEVENSLAAIFHKRNVPMDYKKLIDAQTQQDEINFINDLQAELDVQNEADKTWLEDNIAYIVGKGTNRRTGEKMAFRWVNRNIVIDRINVDPKELKPIVDAEVQRAYRDVVK